MIDDVIMWWGKCVKRQGMYVKKLSFNLLAPELFFFFILAHTEYKM